MTLSLTDTLRYPETVNAMCMNHALTHLREKERRACSNGLNAALMRLAAVLSLLSFAAVIFSACGKYPQPIDSAEEIKKIPRDTEMVTIPLLPVDAYPLLKRFTNLQRIDFYDRSGNGADDERLRALAQLDFTRLEDISLLNCPRVTDAGVLALTNVTSLKCLQLEGTAITDATLYGIRSNLWIEGLNVANCDKVSFNGLAVVLEMPSLEEISFSVKNINQNQVVDLIGRFRSVKHCEIVDPSGKLDIEPLRREAAAKGVRLLVRRGGALQAMNEEQ